MPKEREILVNGDESRRKTIPVVVGKHASGGGCPRGITNDRETG